MSGRKKAGSWQEGVARSFSRLFSRNHSQDKEESDSPAKSALSKETNQEIKQEAETQPAWEATDSQEDENNSHTSEINSYQPSGDPIVISDKGENNSSVEAQGYLAANEETYADYLPRLLPDVKAPEHDRQPRDNFLQFLGNLFNFPPKILSTEVKEAATKTETSETGNKQKDQSSLCEVGPLIQKQSDISRAVSTSKEEADDDSRLAVSTSKEDTCSTTEDNKRKDVTPASALTRMESNEETTKAQEQLQRREDATAVTYATYRGSRQIRKLLKRRASVDSTIPEKEDIIENQRAFIVTKCGEIENIVSVARKNEGYLPNGIRVAGDMSLAQHHVPNSAVKSNAFVENVSFSLLNEKSDRVPNLSPQTNSIANCDEKTDKEPYIHMPVSRSLEDCNKHVSPETTLLNNCILDKDGQKTSSNIPGVVNSYKTEPISGPNTNTETSTVPFQPKSDYLTLEHGSVSSHPISDRVDEERNLEESEVSLRSAAHDNMETTVPLLAKSECLALEHGAVCNHHICDKIDNEINLEELEFLCTSKNKVIDKNMVLIDKTYNILKAEKKLPIEPFQLSDTEKMKEMSSSLMQVYDLTSELNYSAISVQESKINNNFTYTPNIENSHLTDLVTTSEERNGDKLKPLLCSVINCDASLAIPQSGNFNKTNVSHVICPAEPTRMTDVEVLAAEDGSVSEGKVVPISKADISSYTEEPGHILQATITVSTATEIHSQSTLTGDLVCPSAFADGDEIEKNDKNNLLCNRSSVSNQANLQFGDVRNNMSLDGTDECGFENAICPSVASHGTNVASGVHLTNTFSEDDLTDASCFTHVSNSANINEFNPDTLHSIEEIQGMTDFKSVERNAANSSSVLAPKSVMFQGILPRSVTSNCNISSTSESSIVLRKSIVAETNTLCVATENGTLVNQVHAAPTGGDDTLDELEPSSFYYNIGGTCLPSFLPSNRNIIKISSSNNTSCNNGSDAISSPITILPEDCKLANEVMEGCQMTNRLEEQVPMALESQEIDGDISVAKISIKSVNVNEVKISPCVFQSEIVKLSIHSSKAFEPEYVLLPNLSPPLPPVEPTDTVTNINSIPAFENVDFPSPTVATIHDQANTFSSSIDGKHDRMLINSSPCICSKDITVNSFMAKTNCIGDSVESFFTTNEDIVLDNISASAIKHEHFCDIFPSILKHGNPDENSATHSVVENRKVTANNVLLTKDMLRSVAALVIDGRDLTDTDSIAVAEGMWSPEMGDGRLINPCQPQPESIDVVVPIVFSVATQSQDNVMAEVLPQIAISKPTSNTIQEKVAHLIRRLEGMLGDPGLHLLHKSEGIESKKVADISMTDTVVSNKCSEQISVKECEENKTVTFAVLDSEPQDFKQILLKEADKIASDVLRLSLTEIKSVQKITTLVCENPLRTAEPDVTHGKKERESVITDPVENCHGDFAKNVLTVSGNESNVKKYFVNRAYSDTSLKPETFYTEDILAQKAEEITKDVMSIVKQQLSSGQLKTCLDKNHNETIIKTANPVFTENINAMDETAIPIIEPLWSNICTSLPVNCPLKETEYITKLFPTIDSGVSVGTDEVAIFSETVQNNVAASKNENGLFSFDDSMSADSYRAEMLVDTVNVDLIKEEMNESKWYKNTNSNKGCTSKLTLNQNERTCVENVDNYDPRILFTEQIPQNIIKNNIISKAKKDEPQNSKTEGKLNNVINCLQHEAYTQQNSLAGDDSDHKNKDIFESIEMCLPPYPILDPLVQNALVCEENEDVTPYYFESSNLINVTNDGSGLDSFEIVQAKPFRVFPFALSPIYEDDSSREDIVSSDNSPGYSHKRSSKEASSILSLLQSVSERLKHDNSLDEEEEFDNENLPAKQNKDLSGNLNKAHTKYDIDICSSPKMTWSSLEDTLSFLPKSEHFLTETFPSLKSEDCRNRLPKIDKDTMLKPSSRSVYYQYLQNAKEYSSEKGPKMGSILHEILMPRPIQLQVFDSVKTELPLVNPEQLKYNPRPGKMVIHDKLCSGKKLEIYSDVHDATSWTFPSEALVEVVRGCWVLHENPSFQGRIHVLEEGETILNNSWYLNNMDLEIITIGSIQQLGKDGAFPEMEMWPKCNATAVPPCLHSEIANLHEHNADIPTSIIVKSGAWLAYTEADFKGTMKILESSPSPIPADFKSLRPLKMGGLKVQSPLYPTIVIYEKPNFSGWWKTLTEHVYSVTTWFSKECDLKGIGSIRVCRGVWVAYDHERYKGRQYLLEEGEYADWHAWGGVNDAVLSFRYLQADFLEASVTLYESDAENGKLIDIKNQEIPDLKQVGFCSETRSIHVQRGVWVAYQQKHFCGEQYVLEKGKYKCFSDWGGNNTILSIRPVMLEPVGRDKHPHLIKTYSGENFHGHSAEYMSEASDFKPQVPCSFRVLQGCWLLGYQGDATDEQCVLEEGHYPDLASCGCPTAHIVSLKPVDYVFAEPSISLFALDSCEGREVYFEEAVNSVLSKDLHFYTQSVWVRSGLWIVYEGANFLGKQMLLEKGEILNWSEFSGWKAIGSLRPVKQPTVFVRIKNRALDKYLTVTGKLSDARAATVCMAPYNGKNSQIWYFCRGLFKSKINHACLDVIGGRDVPGSKVALWTEHEKSRQKWIFDKDGTITSYISNDLVLDVKGGNYYDKNSIIVNNPVANQLTQKWEMEIL
ncbi:hypothetical protein NDU88_005401 [Pleurodeles waltl]|uniref:Beta/gamma crystallin 'Greek key' domain-containing protein n=1 Tax=Pleurodeles waltl TaxID=8319 RepID=A0AAV7NME1_PLEWA|nr:hypothetical protein NDU88_005401 [Pleurodeles waltl]